MVATSSAPKARIICPIIRVWRIVVRVSEATKTDRGGEVLRLRRCSDPTCNTLFTICASCDRGQRYCSKVCRKRTRQEQLRAAGRRYQVTAGGKTKHCERPR